MRWISSSNRGEFEAKYWPGLPLDITKCPAVWPGQVSSALAFLAAALVLPVLPFATQLAVCIGPRGSCRMVVKEDMRKDGKFPASSLVIYSNYFQIISFQTAPVFVPLSPFFYLRFQLFVSFYSTRCTIGTRPSRSRMKVVRFQDVWLWMFYFHTMIVTGCVF